MYYIKNESMYQSTQYCFLWEKRKDTKKSIAYN